ncbi:MAG: hypothetical protein IT578_00640 [Verrucomicrobiae bacterium]|nr:hypothetical protein [Verrucomicrobiae bacterium]
MPLHLHPLFNTADVYGHGRPTRLAHAARDVRQRPGRLPVSKGIGRRTFAVPWFKRCRPGAIVQCACAFRKVALRAECLQSGDPGDPPHLGGWHFFFHQ